MNRAYTQLEIRAVADASGKRTFTGIASSVSTDRMGDIVEPKGIEADLPIPFLWQHSSYEPIGWIKKLRVVGKNVEVEGEVHNEKQPGKLKDRLDEYWQMLQAGLVRGLSIGFNAVESARIEGTYGIHFLRVALLEISAVTIPAHQDASITAIKSVDRTLLAASGREHRSVDNLPGASGKKAAASGGSSSTRSQKGNDMKTIQELRTERETKAARCNELLELRKAEDRKAFNDDEAEEFDRLTDEIKALDDEIRVMKFHATNSASAREVKGGSFEEGSRSRGAGAGGMSFARNQDPDDKFKGQSLTRLAMAKAAAYIAMREGNFVSAGDWAEKRWGKTHPNLVRYIKAAVAGGGTGSGEWGAELAQSDTRYNGDFIEFLYALTVFDRLPLRPVPARIHIKGQDGAATGYWVGESKAIPVSKPDFSDVELTPLKVGAIAVCSKELVADSDPSAELWIRDSIAQASAQRVDTTFLSATAASAGVSPAGILNGVTALTPSGTDAAAVRADYQALTQSFRDAKNGSGLVHVMTPSLAVAINMMVNSLGQTEFPDITEEGGTLFKRPVYTGDNVTPGDWIVLKPSDIWKIGDSGVQLSMSDSAMVEQDSAPQGATDTPVAASATMVSLWQEESIGFKVVRRINYAKRRTSAVALLSNAEYGGVVS